MKKRILSLVLALSMMISLFPVSALAQTPGGGTAEMAEENGENIDAANGADVTTIQIDSNGEPVGNDGANGKNWEYDSNLTLKKGTYTFRLRSLAALLSMVQQWLAVRLRVRSGMK